jgi:hypothetical protein
MIADVAKVGDIETAPARELWRNKPDDRVFTNIARMFSANGHIVFPLSPQTDEWDRYWSISITNPQPDPVMLTTADGLIEKCDVGRAIARWQDAVLHDERERH